MSFTTHRIADSVRYRTMTTSELRESYLCDGLFAPGEVRMVLSVELDRAVYGAACPVESPLELPNPPELRAEFFCERRELGAINLGGPGSVQVDAGDVMQVDTKEVVYVGRGSRRVRFASDDASRPARFLLLSFPAHTAYPTTLAKRGDANRVDLGSDKEANRRTIYQYIHENGVKSCQLVMGFTELAEGSVWNTMPPHTHDRRCEVYVYFDIPREHRVLHLMGEPQETRSLWVSNGDALLSPPWSIHCGCGTASYSFVWGMGGENQRFDDMDPAPIRTLR